MTVKELKEQLEKLNPDTEVYVHYASRTVPITSVKSTYLSFPYKNKTYSGTIPDFKERETLYPIVILNDK